MYRFVRLIILLLCAPAVADAPLPPPAAREVASQNGEIVVVSKPSGGTQVLDVANRRELWSMPRWFRWLFVSNDGTCVATGYDGLNLIPQNYSDKLVLVRFWKRGRKVGEVLMKDVYSDSAEPRRTTSHYYWGTIKGFSEEGTFKVERVDGKLLTFPACGAEQ